MSPSSTRRGPDNTQTIARNSFWYGLELVFGLFSAVFVSILVARVIGPQRLGPYNAVVWFTNITAAVGAFGLPLTARKYMAEYLNRGEPGLARSIYLATLRLQAWVAVAVTAVALAVVFVVAAPAQRVFSTLLVLNMAPRMIGFIASQANCAAEAMRRNTVPSLLGSMVTVVLTLLSLAFHWDLPGIALAVVLGVVLETGLKLRSVDDWLRDAAPAAISADLRRHMFRYSVQGLALMLLNIVVWDRSDLFFLTMLNSDKSQITFFTLAFNWADKMLLLPSAFGNSVGVTMMAQYGRGADRLKSLTVEGARYAFLIALPMLGGLACISSVLPLLLGEAYRQMIPVLVIVALMAIPKAVISAPMLLLQTTENQGFLVRWFCICGAVDVTLDVLLIPRHGAAGAALANGIAQIFAAAGMWIHAYRLFDLDLRLPAFGKIALSALGMAAAALVSERVLPGIPGIVLAVLAGAAVWFVLLRLTGALDDRDAQRFLAVGRAVPAAYRPVWERLVGLLAPVTAESQARSSS